MWRPGRHRRDDPGAQGHAIGISAWSYVPGVAFTARLTRPIGELAVRCGLADQLLTLGLPCRPIVAVLGIAQEEADRLLAEVRQESRVRGLHGDPARHLNQLTRVVGA